jgi:glycosyltransferase involved in cell wall biosynthesis
MRIVHAIARLNVGGAALSVLELAAGQQQRGHDVVVVAGRIPPGEESMEYLVEELGVPYIHVPTLQRELAPAADVASVRTLQRLLRDRRADVLHTHTAKAGTTGRIAALLRGRSRPRAIVHTFHGHVLTGYFSPRREQAFTLVERTLARATDALIAVSEDVKDDLVRLGVAPPEKFTVVPYGFDLDARVDASPAVRMRHRSELGVDDSVYVIGWAGRLTEIKRPLDLVRAAALVEGSMLVLAGDGELRAEVEGLAGELGISERVRLLGYVRDLGSLYSAFDSFLLTSTNEGAPVVAIEAQAAGVPVVATDAGGTRSVVEDGETGFVVPIGDVDALARQLTVLRDDPELRARLGSIAAHRMRRRFSVDRMVDDVERVYERAVAR